MDIDVERVLHAAPTATAAMVVMTKGFVCGNEEVPLGGGDGIYTEYTTINVCASLNVRAYNTQLYGFVNTVTSAESNVPAGNPPYACCLVDNLPES